MSEAAELRAELALLRRENASLQSRAEQAEQAVAALVQGEIDAVATGTAPILLQAAQEQLRAREQLLRAVFDGTHDAILLADDSGRYIDVNAAACEILGNPPAALIGRDVTEVTGGLWTTSGWESLRTSGSGSGETSLVREDGTTRDLEFRATANILAGMHLVVLRDVTERKRAEISLFASEERYRRIVEATSEGVWMYDDAGLTTFVNTRMAQLLGCTVASAVGKPIYAFMHDADHEAARARVAERELGTVGRGDFRLRRLDGSDIWVRIHADPLFDSTGRFDGTLAIVEDATDRRRADEVRAWLTAIVDSSEYSIVGISSEGLITTWNRGAENLFGYSAREIIGTPYVRLVPHDERTTFAARIERLMHGPHSETFEVERFRKDGSRVHISAVFAPVCDTNGRVIGASVIGYDLTERRRAEAQMRQVEEQLRQAQKLEAIGSLAGGVAHDFNNLLSVILTYAEFVRRGVAHDESLSADVAEIAKAGRRASDLTRQLLAFSRKQMLQPRVLDLNQIVSDLDRMLRRVLGEDVVLQLRLAAVSGRVLVDPSQLEQVVINLVVNARDAMPRGGTITVETRDLDLDQRMAEHFGIACGPYVVLVVHDTGTGMDALTRARIFEPFFTTKQPGRGTGLGLSTVIGIVRQSGGHIAVESEPGQGSTFKVYLPRTDQVVVPTRSNRPPPTTLVGSETVLLVEDDEQVRGVASTILRRSGYTVLEAQNPGEALLIDEQYEARVDLLLTDVVMPRMNGRQLAERLGARREALKVLFVSGYTADAIIRHGIIDPDIEFLEKPFTPDLLLSKVRAALDSAPIPAATHD